MNLMRISRRDGFLLGLYLCLATSTTGFIQPFVPLYMKNAGLSTGQIGLVTGIATGLALIIQPILGRLSDLLDTRRPFIVASALAAGFAYFGFTWADTAPRFLMLLIMGVNGSMYLSAVGGVLVGRIVDPRQGGKAYASFRIWGSIGYIVISVTSGLYVTLRGGPVSDLTALEPIFRSGPMLFMAIAVIALLLPDHKGAKVNQARVQKAPLPPNLKRFLVAYFLYSLALYGGSPFISLFLDSLGAKGLWVTGAFTAGVVMEVIVMTRSGALSDIYGRRPLLAFSMCLLPLRLLLYVPATGPLWVVCVQAMHGLNFGIVGAVSVAFAIDHTAEGTHGQAQARLAAVAGFATALGPIFFGYTSQVFGLRTMFVFAAAIALSGALVMLLTVEEPRPESRSLADRGPAFLRPVLRLLDNPPRWG